LGIENFFCKATAYPFLGRDLPGLDSRLFLIKQLQSRLREPVEGGTEERGGLFADERGGISSLSGGEEKAVSYKGEDLGIAFYSFCEEGRRGLSGREKGKIDRKKEGRIRP